MTPGPRSGDAATAAELLKKFRSHNVSATEDEKQQGSPDSCKKKGSEFCNGVKCVFQEGTPKRYLQHGAGEGVIIVHVRDQKITVEERGFLRQAKLAQDVGKRLGPKPRQQSKFSLWKS